MFLGHADVVPVDASHWKTDPFVVEESEGRFWGRGVADMKGGFVSLMLAMHSFFQDTNQHSVQTIVAFTSDEEIGGGAGAAYVRDFLSKMGIKPNYVVTGEVSNLDLIVRRRNLLQAIITFEARPTKQSGKLETKEFQTQIHEGESLHAAYFNSEKDQHSLIKAAEFITNIGAPVASVEGEFLKSNSIPRTIRIDYIRLDPSHDQTHSSDRALTGFLNAIPELTRAPLPVNAHSDYGVTITPNVLEFSDSNYKAWVDIRAMLNDKDVVESIFSSILEKRLSNFQVEVKCSGHYVYTPKDAPLVTAARSVLERHRLNPRCLERGGATDGRHFASEGVEVIDLGPVGGNLHGSNEWVEKRSLLALVRIYQELPQALEREIKRQGNF